MTVTLKADTSAALAALAELAHRLPEAGDAVVDLLEAGEELFTLDAHTLPTADAIEVVVRLYPSDRLRVLLSASGAGDVDFGRFEHAIPPVVPADSSTTVRAAQ